MVDKSFFNKIADSIQIDELAQKTASKLDKRNNINDITDIKTLEKASNNEITFLSNRKYISQLKNTKASACILSPKDAEDAPSDLTLLINKNPYLAYAQILQLFYHTEQKKVEISNHAIIAQSAKIGQGCQICAGSIIGENVEIGDNTIIKPGAIIDNNVKIGNDCYISNNVNISYAKIGSNVIIHSGTSIGQDGFGFASDASGHHKILQLGLVIIEDHVEIGANCAIDRGSANNTVIGFGSKLDNLIQIAHNVKIGKYCFLAAQVGIAGSTEIGDYVVMGGQVGISGHLKIGNFARFAAQSGVSKNIQDGQEDYYGYPAAKKKEWQLEKIAVRKLTKKYKK